MKRRHVAVSVSLVLLICLITAPAFGQTASPPSDHFDVTAFGAKADGQTDDTAAIQAAMDAAGQKGGVVVLPAASYLVAGSLRVPAGVSVEGAGCAPRYCDPLSGTVLLATGGRDKEDAPALFEMVSSTSVQGLTVYYPEQKIDDVHPYAWTFHLQGCDGTVENITLINSYNGIRMGPEVNVRHRIRSVYGCTLRRGISVDTCPDIGRIENVHLHCDFWSKPSVGGDFQKAFDYMAAHCEAFIFGRTDWEYVTNTFVFPAKIGYHFIDAGNGAMNGQLCGIGADACNRAMVVEKIQRYGLLITNGEFVSFGGENPIQIVVEPTAIGSIRLENCAFWGPSTQCVVSHGEQFLSLSNCLFRGEHPDRQGEAAVEVDNGKLQLRGCSFSGKKASILLKDGLKHAIVTGNNSLNGLTITNQIGDKAIIADNEPAP